MADYPAGITHRKRISGISHWRWQRYSAVVVFVLMTYFVVMLASLGGLDYVDATLFVSAPVNAVALTVLVLVGLWHAMLGVQTVIEDYVSVSGGRHAVLNAVRLLIGGVGLAMLWAMTRIVL
ncbi:succinate dehydrogenase, hydrophobic membrane anchor protein [SAR116 cluster bacterium]|jgi:succinate dehydrogenase / fumarate reductase membrane anchor subunit|nr:succinate dehydrogenase, hydrophobic membrane anchor protein [SAR116 cluster bacterium]